MTEPRPTNVAVLQRLFKQDGRIKKIFWATTLGALAAALGLARYAPRASIALAGVFTGALAVRWFFQRRNERLFAAAEHGDVEALSELHAHRAERYAALIALAIFDGPARVASIDPVFCHCAEPDCLIGGLDSDLHALLAALRRVDAGLSWKLAAKAFFDSRGPIGEGAVATSIDGARVQVRLAVVKYMLFRSRLLEPSKHPAEPVRGIGGFGRVLRAPLFFAAAEHAKRRGDLPLARELVAKLEPWKPGSRLAAEREKLERALAVEVR